MKVLTIFLSGSVNKGEADLRSTEHFWSPEQERLLRESLSGVVLNILNPNTVSVPKYLMKERFEADINMLKQSDVVLVDARTKKGLGVGAEMVIARQHGIPILTFCPTESEYRGSTTDETGQIRQWVHPFIFTLSDEVFENLPELIAWIKENLCYK